LTRSLANAYHNKLEVNKMAIVSRYLCSYY
jgi:hypothetical protein